MWTKQSWTAKLHLNNHRYVTVTYELKIQIGRENLFYIISFIFQTPMIDVPEDTIISGIFIGIYMINGILNLQ